MSDKTNLADLLALNLHKFEDEVRTIVDKATKELSMEKTLGELEVTWSQMQFETEPHHRTGSNLLKSNEELIETLEENQVSVSLLGRGEGEGRGGGGGGGIAIAHEVYWD